MEGSGSTVRQAIVLAEYASGGRRPASPIEPDEMLRHGITVTAREIDLSRPGPAPRKAVPIH